MFLILQSTSIGLFATDASFNCIGRYTVRTIHPFNSLSSSITRRSTPVDGARLARKSREIPGTIVWPWRRGPTTHLDLSHKMQLAEVDRAIQRWNGVPLHLTYLTFTRGMSALAMANRTHWLSHGRCDLFICQRHARDNVPTAIV
jgi:hypothetical protein